LSPVRIHYGVSRDLKDPRLNAVGLPNRADLFDNLHKHVLQHIICIGIAPHPSADKCPQLPAKRLPQFARHRVCVIHRQQHFPVETGACGWLAGGPQHWQNGILAGWQQQTQWQ
jgi:hypothetical protein